MAHMSEKTIEIPGICNDDGGLREFSSHKPLKARTNVNI